MKTLKEFIDGVTNLWPNLLDEEKDLLCQTILEGNVFKINKILKTLNKNIKEREKQKNENKTD